MAQIRMMNNKFFNECIVRDECSKLVSVLSAIDKWEDVAVAEWRASEPDTVNMSDEQAHWAAEQFNDQAYLIYVTKQSMLGSFAVIAAASIENFFRALYKDIHGNESPHNFGNVIQALEQNMGTSLSSLTGYAESKRLRLLGNCFKHNASKTNTDFVNAFGGAVDQEINFQDEDWNSLLNRTREFLLEAAGRTATNN